MSYQNLKEAVLAVEERCEMWDISWSDWTDAQEIIDFYEIGELTEKEVDVLERAIKTNGASVDEDMSAAQTEYWGVEFSSWR